jgi:hypothetical protein
MTAAQTNKAVTRGVAAPTCAVRLIDRRTGAAHRVNGAPLVVFTRDVPGATAQLMQNRDAAHWEIRVDALATGDGK